MNGLAMLCGTFISSSSRICWSMKAFVPPDIFVGLPERGRFTTELVILNFLIIPTTLAILTSKPSAFNDLKISAGKELYTSSRVIWNFCHDNLQMVWKRIINITTLGSIYKETATMGKVQNMDSWSMDPLCGPGPSKYGPGPWTPYFYYP